MNVLHSLLSFLVETYAIERHLLDVRGELPFEGLPLVTNISVAYLVVKREIIAVPREDHMAHIEGILPTDCKTMSCKRTGRK